MSETRVRFAPSPTGKVHIGNIRAAIYNWLYARHVGGKFLLRVEDTDLERSTPEAIRALFECMEWLGLDWDEEPVYQTKNLKRHLECVEKLLADGRAYECERTGRDGRTGKVVMFRMPEEGVLEFDDLVKGKMRKEAKDVGDFAIVRSDGSPIFHLANVVDDIDQRVTHVIRGDDHVENTFKHLELFRALGAEPPKYGHLPMIVNAQGRPYSKRDGAAFVGEFREKGYLPGALFNYLLLLGWNPGDDREVLSREEMVELFDISKVHVTAAKFDAKKLDWMNGEYFRRMPAEEYRRAFNESAAAAGLSVPEGFDAEFLCRELQGRTKFWSDMPWNFSYFFDDAYEFAEKPFAKHLKKEGAKEALGQIEAEFATLEPFTAKAMEESVSRLAGGGKMGPWTNPLRVAVTGRDVGIGVFETCELLGRGRTLARLRRAMDLI